MGHVRQGFDHLSDITIVLPKAPGCLGDVAIRINGIRRLSLCSHARVRNLLKVWFVFIKETFIAPILQLIVEGSAASSLRTAFVFLDLLAMIVKLV